MLIFSIFKLGIKWSFCSNINRKTKKQKNTLSYITNELNQYTKIENRNKNDEIKKQFAYKYDNNGNLQEDDINKYFYDYKNRLVKVIQKEKVEVSETGAILTTIPEKELVKYTYDTLGRRTKKIKPTGTTTYIYSNQNAIQEETTDTDNILKETRKNIYSNQTDDILTTYITTGTTTKQYYYEKDHLGSITKITDQSGTLVEQYEYDVFGIAYIRKGSLETGTGGLETTLSLTDVEGSEVDQSGDQEEITINGVIYKRYNGKGLIGNTRLYTGREYEKELKLYYNRARYYNPQLGRFISRDPIDISDDVNLYSYVGNNVVDYVDRMGKEKNLIIKRLMDFGNEIINIGNGFNGNYGKEVVSNGQTLINLANYINSSKNTTTSQYKILYESLNLWLNNNANYSKDGGVLESDFYRTIQKGEYKCSAYVGSVLEKSLGYTNDSDHSLLNSGYNYIKANDWNDNDIENFSSVENDNARAGDIIIFGDNTGLGHVGIYLGGDMYISARDTPVYSGKNFGILKEYSPDSGVQIKDFKGFSPVFKRYNY